MSTSHGPYVGYLDIGWYPHTRLPIPGCSTYSTMSLVKVLVIELEKFANPGRSEPHLMKP